MLPLCRNAEMKVREHNQCLKISLLTQATFLQHPDYGPGTRPSPPLNRVRALASQRCGMRAVAGLQEDAISAATTKYLVLLYVYVLYVYVHAV